MRWQTAPLVCLALAVLLGGARSGRGAIAESDPLAPAEIRRVITRAADWQLAHPRHPPREWTNAVFYIGLLAAHRVSGEERYLAELVRVAEEQEWRPGRRQRHADDHAIAQTYLDLYRLRPEARRIEPFRRVVERMMSTRPRWKKPHQTIDYWWSDALFMSPPALAKLARATGEPAYLEFMDRLWRQAYRLLYDRGERLFYRDSRQIGGDGKTFWSRGNAWVLAGLARLLEELPDEHPSREFYVGLLRQMSERVAALQPADGLWRSDLLAPPEVAPGESSGTSLFCYALAWGVDRRLLDRESHLPVVRRAWAALVRNVDLSGRLGWVQQPAVGPDRVRADDWEVYGSGAFLLAGEAVLGLLGGEDGATPEDER